MSVLVFSVGMESHQICRFLNVYTKSTFVEQPDLFGIQRLTVPCFWQPLDFRFSSDFALVVLRLCFPGLWQVPKTFQVNDSASCI